MNADDLVNGRTGIAAAALLAAVGLGLTGAQTPSMAASTGMSTIAKLAAAGGVDALQQQLDARSPGLRVPGALTQTKSRRVASLKEAFGPKERVLSGERTRPTAPGNGAPAIAYETGTFAGGPDLYVPGSPITLPGVDSVIADLNPLPPAVGSYPIPGGGTTPIVISGGGGGSSGGGGGGSSGGGTGGGGGGSGGGNTGGGGSGGTTPGVDSAVPEPATWLSLFIGFFAIGFGLRSGAGKRSLGLNARAFQ